MTKDRRRTTTGDVPKPPRPLGTAGRQLWTRVHRDYGIEDAGGIELLTLASEALDRAEALRGEIERDGSVIRSGETLRDHPALKHELANRAFVARAIGRLGLDVEPVRGRRGRPPGIY